MEQKISRYIILFYIIAIVGCKTSQTVAIEQFCTGPEYMTNNGFYRGNGVMISRSENEARMRAIDMARVEIAAIVESDVKRGVSNYIQESSINKSKEFVEKYEALTEIGVNESIKNSVPICSEVRMLKAKKGEQPKYKAWACVELNTNEILSNISNKISQDEKLRIDFDQKEFKESVFSSLMGE